MSRGPLSQLAEEEDLKSSKSRFKSEVGHFVSRFILYYLVFSFLIKCDCNDKSDVQPLLQTPRRQEWFVERGSCDMPSMRKTILQRMCKETQSK